MHSWGKPWYTWRALLWLFSTGQNDGRNLCRWTWLSKSMGMMGSQVSRDQVMVLNHQSQLRMATVMGSWKMWPPWEEWRLYTGWGMWIPTHWGQSGYGHCWAPNLPTAETNTEPPVWKSLSQLAASWLHKGQWFVLTGISSYYDMDLLSLPAMLLPKSPPTKLRNAPPAVGRSAATHRASIGAGAFLRSAFRSTGSTSILGGHLLTLIVPIRLCRSYFMSFSNGRTLQ